MLYDNPQALHALLDKLAQSVTSYLNGQILAGAQAVQIFDSWGGALSAAAYQEFSLAYMQKIVDGLIREHEGRRVPVILFTKGGGLWLESMANTGAEALGLDWTCDIGSARARVGDKVALQATWTRQCFTPSQTPFALKSHASSVPLVTAMATCSTSATASPRKSTRPMPVPSSRPCTSCRHSTTEPDAELESPRMRGFSFLAPGSRPGTGPSGVSRTSLAPTKANPRVGADSVRDRPEQQRLSPKTKKPRFTAGLFVPSWSIRPHQSASRGIAHQAGGALGLAAVGHQQAGADHYDGQQGSGDHFHAVIRTDQHDHQAPTR